MFNTTILFLIFNRPDVTLAVFEQIRKIQPKYLYVAADGPRADKEGEAALCRETRAIIEQVDWDCEVKTLFRTENLGSGIGILESINWFFSQVEYGIILEDDCLPNRSFFLFCDKLLSYYKNDDKIMQISGSNFLLGFYKTEGYYFSQVPLTWGWATWRRAWEKMDYQMKDYNDKINRFPPISAIWREHWESVISGKIKDAWDFQWYYSIYCSEGVVIHPSVNLVENIGFNSNNATHTFKSPWWYKFVITKELSLKTFKSDVEINTKADTFFTTIFSNSMPNFYQRVILKIRSFLL